MAGPPAISALRRFGFVRFTSCSGCQLAFLNCELDLPALAARWTPVDFLMASSAGSEGCTPEVVFIEGSVSRPAELERLLQLRREVRTLVAVGACALSGGVNALGHGDRMSLVREVYGPGAEQRTTFPPQPISRFVPVDLEVPGCPPEGTDLAMVLGTLERGGLPALPGYAVCMECRLRENLCLLTQRSQPCLGPVVRAGCGAHCPSRGVVCEGCRGWVEEANWKEQLALLAATGLDGDEIRERISRLAGEDR